MPDAYFIPNKLFAVLKRVGAAGPKMGSGVCSDLRTFVRGLLNRLKIAPLLDSEVMSDEDWIAQARYPEWRKAQLREVLKEHSVVRVRHFRCKTFVKTETYSEYKYPRLINSRHDRFKVLTGAFFHAVEERVFKLPMFVKYVPVRDRPKYIQGYLNLDNMRVVATDYSSFEAWFTPEIMRAIEFQLYAHMARKLTAGPFLLGCIEKALAGRNVCFGRGFRYAVDGVRMSGDMCTSLGNGFTNYVLMQWVCFRQGIQCKGLVEGDDGLFQVSWVPDVAGFESAGFKIKMVEHDDVASAGFCKQFYDPSECRNVVDVKELLAKFGWTHAVSRDGGPVVMEELLRAKAASLRAELPSCPIAVALVRAVDRWIGRSGKRRYDGPGGEPGYHEDILGGDTELVEPSMASRILVDRLFGVSVDQQTTIEKYLDGLSCIQELDGPVLPLMKAEWCEYHQRFGRTFAACVDREW